MPPIYEYICETDGTTIELIRPMAAADDPVDDPAGRGRVFKRKHSTFQVGDAAPVKGKSLPQGGGGCGAGCGCHRG